VRRSVVLTMALGWSVGVVSAECGEPTPRAVSIAGAAFRKTCQHCHSVPDLRFETDRMWLDQVQRTA